MTDAKQSALEIGKALRASLGGNDVESRVASVRERIAQGRADAVAKMDAFRSQQHGQGMRFAVSEVSEIGAAPSTPGHSKPSGLGISH